jgi:uncharacterized protein YegJ (DUF2314 family)
VKTHVAALCSHCAPKAGNFTGQEPSSFMGKLVKIGFKVQTQEGRDTLEHMWVKVKDVSFDTWLRGELINTPVMKTTLRHGDMLGFQVSEIEDVLDAPQEN